MNLNQRFDALDEALKLDPAERGRAIELHNHLGDVLVAAGVAERTRLQGSVARKTMLPPLKDVDKVIELADDVVEAIEGPGGSMKAMSIISDVLTPAFSGVQFEIKRHALGIAVPGESFEFDAVPAINPEDGTGIIRIANTEDDRWEDSNTYVLIDTIAARNQQCDGRFVHQVRMARLVVRTAGLAGILPGLHTESFAHDAITRAVAHADAVAATLAAGARLLGQSYADPTGWDRISERLSPAETARAAEKVRRLADRASEAQILAGKGEDDDAAEIWADLFGDLFPRPSGERTFLSSLYGGAGITVTGTLAPGSGAGRTRAWRP